MAGSQGALIWWFEHPELDKSSISRAPYNFLTTGCPPWVLVIIEPLSQVPQRNVFGPFVLFYVTGDFRLTEQIRQRKNKLFCFYWNCDLLLWELFQFSFFNDKSLWRYPVLWPCSWKKLIERNDMPTYSFIQLKSLFFLSCFSSSFHSCWINNALSANCMLGFVLGVGNTVMNRTKFLPSWGRQTMEGYIHSGEGYELNQQGKMTENNCLGWAWLLI